MSAEIVRLLGVGPLSPTITALVLTLMVTGTLGCLIIGGFLAAMLVKTAVVMVSKAAHAAYRLCCRVVRALYIATGGTADGIVRIATRVRAMAAGIQAGAGRAASAVLHGARHLLGLLRPRRAPRIGLTGHYAFHAWLHLRFGRTVLFSGAAGAFTMEALSDLSPRGLRCVLQNGVLVGAMPVRRGESEQDVIRVVRANMKRGAGAAFETVHLFSEKTVSQALGDVVARHMESVREPQTQQNGPVEQPIFAEPAEEPMAAAEVPQAAPVDRLESIRKQIQESYGVPATPESLRRLGYSGHMDPREAASLAAALEGNVSALAPRRVRRHRKAARTSLPLRVVND